jgi:hypothetical protein
VVVPWSSFWERNYFASVVPGVRDLITNNYLRGGISGLGVVNVWLAVGELLELVTSRRTRSESPGSHSG